MAIALLGFLVWAHHMFTTGMDPAVQAAFMVTSMIIAVPTGVKIFNWIGTMWGGVLDLRTPMLFAIGFIAMFLIGGLSGITLASVPVDTHVHDSYYIVGHLHYVLFGGSVLAVFGAFYFWFPKITGKMYGELPWKTAFLADDHWFQPDLLSYALAGTAGHASACRRLRSGVSSDQPIN